VTRKLMELVPLDADHLPILSKWWLDPETKRWMGGYPPEMALRLAADPPPEFRGRRVIDRQALVVLEGGEPRALIDFERYDDSSAGLGIVVEPSVRGRGVGRLALHFLLGSDRMTGVARAFAGIEPDNIASIRCFEGAGFVRESQEPDEEGIVYYSYESVRH